MAAVEVLEKAGYQTIVFHANGAGLGNGRGDDGSADDPELGPRSGAQIQLDEVAALEVLFEDRSREGGHTQSIPEPAAQPGSSVAQQRADALDGLEVMVVLHGPHGPA